MKLYKFFFFLILTFCTLSCTDKPTEITLDNLNGYWEIEKVITKDGITKEYHINTTIDYIELKDSTSGFRKKVQPTLKGTYRTSNDAELFTIVKNKDHYTLDYKSNLDEWKEDLIKLDKNSFTTKNSTGNMYYYKRFENINIAK